MTRQLSSKHSTIHKDWLVSVGVPQAQEIGDAFDRCRFALRDRTDGSEHMEGLSILFQEHALWSASLHSFCEAVYAECAKLSFNFHGQFQL